MLFLLSIFMASTSIGSILCGFSLFCLHIKYINRFLFYNCNLISAKGRDGGGNKLKCNAIKTSQKRGKISKGKEIGVCCCNAGRAGVVLLYRYIHSNIYVYVYISAGADVIACLPASCIDLHIYLSLTSAPDWCPTMAEATVWHANIKATDRRNDSKPKVNCTSANGLNASIRVQLRTLQAGANCRNKSQDVQEFAFNISQLLHKLPE